MPSDAALAPGLTAEPSCSHPNGFALGVIIASNGARHVKLCCHICSTARSGRVKGNPDDYPVLRDNRTGQVCERCGSADGVDEHHWAPGALFGLEASEWPTSLLCPPCHRRWHSIVTPGMRSTT